MKWFNSLPRLVQMILLLIPVVNWVVELVVRWDCVIHKPGNLINLILAIVVTFAGLVIGWVDFIWCLLFKHLICAA